jgi:glycosyltransferase involved in cell wall biosynthesis
MAPRVLFAGHTRYDLPLNEALARKWDAVGAHLDVRIVGEAGAVTAPDPRFRLLRAGRLFFLVLPFVVVQEARRRPPAVIVAQSPYEGLCVVLVRRLLPRGTHLVVEVHGDWRSATRLYGGGWRRAFAPLADAAAAFALRRADATRVLSGWTSRLAREVTGREPAAVFPTFSDLGRFLETPPRPLPTRPRVIWVGALQPVKNVDALTAVWPRVAAKLPEARLTIVGDGPLAPVVKALVSADPERVEWHRSLGADQVAARFDEASVLFLPSRSEGLGRVILEAHARGRPVVASDLGGIVDLVEDGVNGWRVAPGDHDGFVSALVRTLSDAPAATRMGAAGRAWVEAQPFTAAGYGEAMRGLVDRVTQAR